MPSVLDYGRAAGAGLAAFVWLVLILRMRPSPRRGEDGVFALVLALAAVRAVVPWGVSAGRLGSFLLVWAMGLHAFACARGSRPPRLWLWHTGSAAGLLAAAASVLTGHSNTLPSQLLYGFTFAPLAAYVLARYFRMLAAGRRFPAARADHGALSAYVFAAAGLLALFAAETLVPGVEALRIAALAAALLFLGAAGMLVVREGSLLNAVRAGERWTAASSLQEFRALRARLAETEHSLFLLDRLIAAGLLAAGTAHEFKNILSGIRSSAEFALRGVAAYPVQEALKGIVEHVRQGELSVSRDLEQIVRYGREEPRPVELGRDLAELFRLLRASCRHRGVGFGLRIDPALVVVVRPGEITQVLVNLVRNALESLGQARDGVPEPRLTVRARSWEGEALVEILDNGPGIAPEQVGRLFELAASDRGSTGLGLYLSRMLVERNGGTMEYVPVEAGGCFRLTLPLADSG